MKSFDYYNPVRIHFGKGVLNEIGDLAKTLGKRICLVSYKDLSFLEPLCNKIVQLLKKEGLAVFTFYEAEPNPDINTVIKGAEFCGERNIDLIAGIGGGSAMDAAKAIAAGVFYEGDPWNMVNSRHDNNKAIPPESALPTLMVPTLPATGSEMNPCAVISNGALKEKSYVWAECLYPKVSILDPELTRSLPAYQTACAAADSISHVLEIYINGEENSPLQHAFQEGVMRTVINNVQIALQKPQDIDARSNLLWASTCAINGWASPADAWTPIHQVAHNLSSLYGIAHGASLSALMPAWMKTFWPRRKKRYLDFARNVMDVGVDGKSEDEIIQEGIRHFEDFLIRIGVPVTLKEINIADHKLNDILNGVKKVSFGNDGFLGCVPPVSADDIMRMLKNADPA